MFENNKIDAYQIRENILLLEACSVQDSENKAVTQHPGSVLRLLPLQYFEAFALVYCATISPSAG